MPYSKIKMGKNEGRNKATAGSYGRTPAPAGKVRNDMDPKKGYKKPKPGKPSWMDIMPVPNPGEKTLKPLTPGKRTPRPRTPGKPGLRTIQPVKPGLKRGR